MYEPLRTIEIEEPKTHVPGALPNLYKTNLANLYERGWWITEIFGSYAVLVKVSDCKTRKSKAPYFICMQSQINVDQITPPAKRIIKRIANQQWKKYGKKLTTSKFS